MTTNYKVLIFILLFLAGCEPQEFEVPLPNLPPEEFLVEVSDVTYNSAKIKWSHAVDPESELVTYDVYLNDKLISKSIKETNFDFIDLLEESEYKGIIIAKDIVGNETRANFKFVTDEYISGQIYRLNYAFWPNCQAGTPNFIFETKNGNFIIVGETNHYSYESSLIALEADSLGNEIWKKSYRSEFPSDVYEFKSVQTPEGFLILIKNRIIYIDHFGEVLWNKSYPTFDYIYDVELNSKGNLILIGKRFLDGDFLKPNTTLFVASWDKSGKILWEKDYERERSFIFERILIKDNDDIFIVGEKNQSFGHGNGQGTYWLSHLNENGEMIRENTLSERKNNLSGPYYASILKENGDLFVVDSRTKIRVFSAELEFKKEINTNLDFITSIRNISNDEFMAVGRKHSSQLQIDIFFAKYTSSGEIVFEKSYSEQNIKLSAMDVVESKDGDFWMISNYQDLDFYASYCNTLMLINTDSKGRFNKE